MRDLIEKGRVVEFKCKSLATKLGVIVDFVTQSSFVVQMVCAKTGKVEERKVMSQKYLTLTPSVIEMDDSETERGSRFTASVEKAITAAVTEKQQSAGYQAAVRAEKLRELNDFERFLEEQKELAREQLLRAKGF